MLSVGAARSFSLRLASWVVWPLGGAPSTTAVSDPIVRRGSWPCITSAQPNPFPNRWKFIVTCRAVGSNKYFCSYFCQWVDVACAPPFSVCLVARQGGRSGLMRLFTACAPLFSICGRYRLSPLHGIRVGEACKPGPPRQTTLQSFFRPTCCPPQPTHHRKPRPAPTSPGDVFVIAVVNPTSVLHKSASLLQLGADVLALAELQPLVRCRALSHRKCVVMASKPFGVSRSPVTLGRAPLRRSSVATPQGWPPWPVCQHSAPGLPCRQSWHRRVAYVSVSSSWAVSLSGWSLFTGTHPHPDLVPLWDAAWVRSGQFDFDSHDPLLIRLRWPAVPLSRRVWALPLPWSRLEPDVQELDQQYHSFSPAVDSAIQDCVCSASVGNALLCGFNMPMTHCATPRPSFLGLTGGVVVVLRPFNRLFLRCSK